VGPGADGGLGSRGKFWWSWSEGRVGNRIAVGGQRGLAEAIKCWWAERISGKEKSEISPSVKVARWRIALERFSMVL